MNIELVHHVDWWEHPKFVEENHRHAAEMIAFDVLDPALRSRGRPRRNAQQLASDGPFRVLMQDLFAQSPTGRLTPPRLSDIATRLSAVEARLDELERGPLADPRD